ncbi:MAG: hypothetical protein CL489_17925 [Acidobacteria bacterium]|nr:hypothetical protein [Acidobacteriota bacterium]|tara:strand:- start:2428 stop:2844 length:417 start_codon:yes stop_codon:yes gene_type:complete
MGMKMKGKFGGNCKVCGSKWRVDDDFYWHKNQDNSTVKCIDLECFKEQGGTLNDKQSILGSRNDTIVVKLPDCEVSDDVKRLTEFEDELFITAHHKMKDRYPDEPVSGDRFGRIRSQYVGQLIDIKLVYLLTKILDKE